MAHHTAARRRAGRLPAHEIAALAAAAVLLVGVFALVSGPRLFPALAPVEEGPVAVNVVGRQWVWKVRHADGREEVNRLTVPAGRPVELGFTSEDVIHSFRVPSLNNAGQFAIPDRTATLKLGAMGPGEHNFYCTEYCGIEHSQMVGKLVVLPAAEYRAWQAGNAAPPEKR